MKRLKLKAALATKLLHEIKGSKTFEKLQGENKADLHKTIDSMKVFTDNLPYTKDK